MYHTFDQSVQVFPMQAIEHMMISLSEPDGVLNIQRKDTMFLVPQDVAIFATSLMGSLYYAIKHRPEMKRLVFLRCDSQVPNGEIWTTKSAGVSQVLGQKISYDYDMVQDLRLRSGVLHHHDDYFAKNHFWYTQMNYVAMCHEIKVLPLVFSDSFVLREHIHRLASLLPEEGETANRAIVLADDLHFRIRDTDMMTEIAVINSSIHHPWFDMLCGYGDMITAVPNIMRIEALDPEIIKKDQEANSKAVQLSLEEGRSEVIYHGILSV